MHNPIVDGDSSGEIQTHDGYFLRRNDFIIRLRLPFRVNYTVEID